jgi:chemotaxis response regulator CheB
MKTTSNNSKSSTSKINDFPIVGIGASAGGIGAIF